MYFVHNSERISQLRELTIVVLSFNCNKFSLTLAFLVSLKKEIRELDPAVKYTLQYSRVH